MIISDPRRLRDEWRRQYDRLTKEFSRIVPPKALLVIEIGCGRGQLTIPFAKHNKNLQIIAVDNFGGPYVKNRVLFSSILSKENLSNQVSIVESDYLAWLSNQENEQHRLLISNEFLPEIDSAELHEFLSECYRVLRSDGITAHSFLSPLGKNSEQRLLLEADSDPKWTKFPPKEWFSPKPNLVASQLKEAGFTEVRIISLKSNLTIKAEAAKSLLRSWNVRSAFWKQYYDKLMSSGLGIPDWLIVVGRKQAEA